MSSDVFDSLIIFTSQFFFKSSFFLCSLSAFDTFEKIFSSLYMYIISWEGILLYSWYGNTLILLNLLNPFITGFKDTFNDLKSFLQLSFQHYFIFYHVKYAEDLERCFVWFLQTAAYTYHTFKDFSPFHCRLPECLIPCFWGSTETPGQNFRINRKGDLVETTNASQEYLSTLNSSGLHS